MTIDLNKTVPIEFTKNKTYPTYSLGEFMIGVQPKLIPTTFTTDLMSTVKGIVIENNGKQSKIVIPVKNQQPIICVVNNNEYKIV